ncbi:MAG: carbon monoxide dehydrogenase [Rhodospirillaceae bacterium]|nr:carbon monoxide dehydrogenase [Rhodospirillaceae bacterium]|tara:strand:+ start:2527 stop:3321 length:795 start_codon:yes stop_codon:yes gene_type:complete
MHDFNYQNASSISDAINAHKGASDGTYLAGGQTLLPTLKQRLAQPSDLIDLAGISDLSFITMDKELSIGAMTTHSAVASSEQVAKNIPALVNLARGIGDPQVRNRGTIGGSIANNDPAADYPAACLALNANIVTDRREIHADDFFTGMFDTALDEGELITSVKFSIPEKACYMKFPNPASRYALVGVFVATRGAETRVAVTGAGEDGVFRASELEDALSHNFSSASIEGVEISPDGLMSDIHAQSDYRASLIVTMAKRAVAAAG